MKVQKNKTLLGILIRDLKECEYLLTTTVLINRILCTSYLVTYVERKKAVAKKQMIDKPILYIVYMCNVRNKEVK
ncbi:hypothetical protein L1275_000085 [Flavobacterium sp. HSC-61S13]|nr:hypothetical protein [Flavobacterium sp. HSC-61S13]